ncbi:MAG: hypothetical protein AB8F26_02505 [Phycisphaerales bacterium]
MTTTNEKPIRLYRLGETVHIAALGVWTGALVGAGISAAVVFPTVRDLDPALPEYTAYEGPHWMLSAGMIASRVFLITDIIQFVCACLAVVGFGLAVFVGKPARNWGLFLRALLLGLAFLAVSYHLLMLMPAMQSDLRQYWNAALAGDTATAEQFRQAFSDRHQSASRSIGGTALATLGALIAGVWMLAGNAKGLGVPDGK